MSDSTALSKLLKASKHYKRYIGNYREFHGAVEELDSMIGNARIKRSIADCLLYVLGNKRDSIRQPGTVQSPMLNIILSGPPATGKTLIAKKLAMIMSAIGVLRGSSWSQAARPSMDSLGLLSVITVIAVVALIIYLVLSRWLSGLVLGLTIGVVAIVVVLAYAGSFQDLQDATPGNFIQVERADLVGEYSGWTEAKTRRLLNRARGARCSLSTRPITW